MDKNIYRRRSFFTKNLRFGGGRYFFHYDGWGNVIELTGEAGQSQASYSYDAYGNEIKRTGGEDNAYRFSTKEYSSLTGLIYFGARYYDPEIGRFLTKDPLGFAGGINQYIYCESDPVNWIDPWGLCKGGDSRWKWSPGNWWNNLVVNDILGSSWFWQGISRDFKIVLENTQRGANLAAISSAFVPGGQGVAIGFAATAALVKGIEISLYSDDPVGDTVVEVVKQVVPAPNPALDPIKDEILDQIDKRNRN